MKTPKVYFPEIGVKYKLYNPYFVAGIAVLGGSLFGFDISSMSSFIAQEPYIRKFGTANTVDGVTSYSVAPIRQAGITSSMPGGSIIGSLASGYLADMIGRKPVIQIASWVWMIGAAIQCSSQNITQLIFGRVIAGFAVGLASSQVPVYIAEMSPKNIRGRLVGLFQWAVTIGILVMYVIGYGCGQGFKNEDKSWRLAWGIQMVPALFLFIGTLFLNESPRWLASRDRWEEAITIIANVQAKGDRDADLVKIEVEEIKEAVRIDQTSNFRFWDLFRGRTNLRRTMVGIWTQIWQQLTGMNVMMYYIVDIFLMTGGFGSGDATETSLIASIIQYVLNVVMTVPALLFIDKWGRRRVLFYGAILMMAWLWAMAGILAVYAKPTGPEGFQGNPQVRIRIPADQRPAANAAIAVSYLFVCTFAPTWGPSGWIYVSEIFPLEQRAYANGLCAAWNWIFNFAIGMFTPSAFANITWKTYVIFAVFCFCMAIHVFVMFPETHKHTLEEIGMLWEENIPAWRTSSWKPSHVPDIRDINAAGGGHAPEKIDVEHSEHAGTDSVSSLEKQHSQTLSV